MADENLALIDILGEADLEVRQLAGYMPVELVERRFTSRLGAASGSPEAMESVRSLHGKGSPRARIMEFLHSKEVQITLLCLLLFDVIIIFIKTFLDAEFPYCRIIIRDAISCGPAAGSTPSSSYSYNDPNYLCLSGNGGNASATGFEAACDPKKHSAAKAAQSALLWISVGILCTFVVEISTTIVCVGFKKFFGNPWHVIDLVAILASLSLEIALDQMKQTAIYADIVAMVIIVRVWRVFAIAHNIVQSSQMQGKLESEAAKEAVQRLEKVLFKMRKQLSRV